MNMSQILSISRSGLNAYQREMDVVSNNLANVDTLGYKDKRTTFQELLNNGTTQTRSVCRKMPATLPSMPD